MNIQTRQEAFQAMQDIKKEKALMEAREKKVKQAVSDYMDSVGEVHIDNDTHEIVQIQPTESKKYSPQDAYRVLGPIIVDCVTVSKPKIEKLLGDLMRENKLDINRVSELVKKAEKTYRAGYVTLKFKK